METAADITIVRSRLLKSQLEIFTVRPAGTN